MDGFIFALFLAAIPDAVFEAQVRNLGHDDFDTRVAAADFVGAEFRRCPSEARVRRLLAAEQEGDPEVVYRLRPILDPWAAPLVKQVTRESLKSYPAIKTLPGFRKNTLAMECWKEFSNDGDYYPSYIRSRSAMRLYCQKLVRHRMVDPKEVNLLTLALLGNEWVQHQLTDIANDIRDFVRWWNYQPDDPE